MKELDKILSKTRQAVQKYDMIMDGDTVAVGVSGGKDSLTLLYALSKLRLFYPAKFKVLGITVDLGFDGVDYTGVKDLCDELDIEYHVISTEIADIIFKYKKDDSPCSLCAMMRRGALNNAALEYGANKIALAHHLDDVAETVLMKLLFEGNFGCFQPVTEYEDKKISIIRPFIYVREGSIKYFCNSAGLPVVFNPCPADGHTQRENAKKFLRESEREHKGTYNRILGALERSSFDMWHK